MRIFCLAGATMLAVFAGGCGSSSASNDTTSLDSHLEQATSVQIPLVGYDGKPLSLHNAELVKRGEAPVAATAVITDERGHTFADVEIDVNARFKRAGLEAPYFYDAGIAMFVTNDATTMCFRGDPVKAVPMMVQLRNFEHSVSMGSFDATKQVLVVLDDDGFGDTTELRVPRCRTGN